jgi:hypothetical protein
MAFFRIANSGNKQAARKSPASRPARKPQPVARISNAPAGEVDEAQFVKFA